MRLLGSSRFHRRLARRYGAKAFTYCDHRARRGRRIIARGARAPCLDCRQVGLGEKHAPLQSRHGRHLRRRGRFVIDPHGDLAEDILDAIPRSRINEVCYLDAGETEYPVGFNPATRIAPERQALAASGIVAAFKHLWSDSWGPRLEHFLYHGVAALISREHATLIDLARLYTDDRFRDRVLGRNRSETRRFWLEDFPATRSRFAPKQSRRY